MERAGVSNPLPAVAWHTCHSSFSFNGSTSEQAHRSVQQLQDTEAGPSRGDAYHIWSYLALCLDKPTEEVVAVQGILGSTPWNALVFLTLYMQLLGMSDTAAAALMALFLGGTAAGGLLGGYVGDIAAKRAPSHGRILVCQFSVVSGVPLSLLLLKVLSARNDDPREASCPQEAMIFDCSFGGCFCCQIFSGHRTCMYDLMPSCFRWWHEPTAVHRGPADRRDRQ